MHILIDGDITVYRVGFSSDDLTEKYAKARATKLINTLVERCGGTEYTVFLTCSGRQFRHDIATIKPYKGNRAKANRPKHYSALRDHLISRFDAVVSEYEEADDLIGIAGNQLRLAGKPFTIATIDKDLRMIPGNHYNWVKGLYDVVTPEEARLNFYCQLVTGDATDNIPGFGRGAKAITQELTKEMSEHDLYATIFGHYAARFGDDAEERLREVGRLLWIRRHKGQLWNPPSDRDSGMAAKASRRVPKGKRTNRG